jgi:hypothetical protein
MPPSRTIRCATVACCLLAAAGIARAAGEERTPSRLSLDVTGPLFAADATASMLPGASRTACATVTHAGDTRTRVALHAPAARGELARFLDLTVVRGTRPADASAGCERFVADPRDHGLGFGGAIFRGRLSDFPRAGQEPVVDPVVWSPGDATGYRFELRLADDPAAEGLSTSWDWAFAVDPLPAPPRPVTPKASPPAAGPPPACRSFTARPGTRLTKRFAYPGRRRVLVTAKVSPTGVRLSARLLTRRGRVLRNPGWTQVAFALNKASVVAYRRPFEVLLPPRVLHAGRNVVTLDLRARSGRPRRLRMTLQATPVAGRCELG